MVATICWVNLDISKDMEAGIIGKKTERESPRLPPTSRDEFD